MPTHVSGWTHLTLTSQFALVILMALGSGALHLGSTLEKIHLIQNSELRAPCPAFCDPCWSGYTECWFWGLRFRILYNFDVNKKISVLFGHSCVIKATQPRWSSANWFSGNLQLEQDRTEPSAIVLAEQPWSRSLAACETNALLCKKAPSGGGTHIAELFNICWHSR